MTSRGGQYFYRFSSACHLIEYNSSIALRRASLPLLTVCLASCAASQRLALQDCLTKSRVTHCLRNMVVPGLVFSRGAKVALRFSGAGLRRITFFDAPLANAGSIGPPAVCRHMARAKTAVTLNFFFFFLVRRKNGEIFYRRCTVLS